VVVADRYDEDWRAWVDGQPAPILRTNHVLRGVQVSAGKSTIEFRYEPAGLAFGMRVCAVAAALLMVWTLLVWFWSNAISLRVQQLGNAKSEI
jgi:uncharacterized membrane protein YfhO